MSTTPKKPAPASTVAASATGRKQSANPPPRSSSPTTRGQSPSRMLSSHGVASSQKSSSGLTRPTRATVRRPGQVSNNLGSGSAINLAENGKDDDLRIEHAAIIDNLKKSLRNAEIVSEDYQTQLAVALKKIDDLMREHSKMEEHLHESVEKIEELEADRKETSRQVRDIGSIYESERTAMLRDREDAKTLEMELRSTIQRLKETMAGREMRFAVDERRHSRTGRSHSRSSSVDEGGFAPPSSIQRREPSLQRSDSKSTSRLVMQKDMVIESLRLELAEAQIKQVEMENMGGDRMQELERVLLETRMTNARLMEDNESFQLLLGEKTLNGDFTKTDFMQGSSTAGTAPALGSLAEELESAEGESENYRRLEAENRSMRDQNKALTLYIEKIISRVLQHDNFETILDQKPGLSPGAQKELPPPPAKDEPSPPSVLQRAMSVVGSRKQRPTSQVIAPSARIMNEENASKTRPQSQIFAPAPFHTPTANEDPFTAPRVPLGRTQSVAQRGAHGHRRSYSEQSNEIGNAASVVNQMYRGTSGSGGPISPISPGSTTPRTAYFAPSGIVGSNVNANRPSTGSRAVSGARPPSGAQYQIDKIVSSSNSTLSRESGEVPSPPRNSAGNTTYTGAVMTQNKLRPLRLVQENKDSMETLNSARRPGGVPEDEAARKKANRGSWMGWFNRGKEEGGPGGRSVSGGQGAEE